MLDPVGQRIGWQVFGYCGIDPVRRYYFGMVRDGGAERGFPGWAARLRHAARTAARLRLRPVARDHALEARKDAA